MFVFKLLSLIRSDQSMRGLGLIYAGYELEKWGVPSIRLNRIAEKRVLLRGTPNTKWSSQVYEIPQ